MTGDSKAEPGVLPTEGAVPGPVAPAGGKRGRRKPAKRPRVITLLAVYMLVAGVFALLGAVTAFGIDAVLKIGVLSADTVQKVKVGEFGLIVDGVLLLIGGAVDVTVGVGALRLKPWAWTLGVAVAIYDILIRLWTLATDDFSWPVAIGAALAVVVLFYLQQEDVKRAFGR